MAAHKLAEQVSILLPARECKERVLSSLRRLQALEASLRICVVDNGSSDGTTDAVVREFPGIQLVRLASDRGAAAVNVGMRELNTPYVALCEPGLWWAWGALTRAVRLLEQAPRVAALNARVLRGAQRAEDAACSLLARSPLPSPLKMPGRPRAAGCVSVLPGCAVLRRCAFLSVGGYDLSFAPGAEHRVLAYELLSAGWTLAYVPGLTVHGESPPCSSSDPTTSRTALHRQLCVSWARRPWTHALLESARLIRGPLPAREALLALCAALRSIPWVMRRRKPLPPPIAAAVRRAELGAFAPGGVEHTARALGRLLPDQRETAGSVVVRADFPYRRAIVRGAARGERKR